MQIGEIIQTNLYARKNYKGRKVKVLNIQEDFEEGVFKVTASIVKKNGNETRTIVEFGSERVLH